eukprot:4820034-Amphidinium_carterae.1
MVLHLLGMEGCKAVTSPMLSRSQEQPEANDDEELDKEETTLYKKCVGILLYLAQDRVDIQFACRILSQSMARPTVLAFRRLKRMARYLRGTVDYHIEIKREDLQRDVFKVHGDADWAGDKTRRSVSAGVMYWDNVLLFAWSRFQTALALSSGESEYYQLTTAAGEASFVRQLLEFMGELVSVELYTDSSAALGMCKREGTGNRMRHVDLRMLWLQQHVKCKQARIFKIAGANNTADVGTKALAAPILNKHLVSMGFKGKLLEHSGMDTKSSAMRVQGVMNEQAVKAIVVSMIASLVKGASAMGAMNEEVGMDLVRGAWIRGALIMEWMCDLVNMCADWVNVESDPEPMRDGGIAWTVTLTVIAMIVLRCMVSKLSALCINGMASKRVDEWTQTEPIEYGRYHKMTAFELKALCRERKLATKGWLKDDLIAALAENEFQGRA